MKLDFKPNTNTRIQYDKNKALRSVFLPKESSTTDLKPMAMLNKDSSKDVAREILKNNSDKFGWSENLEDIVLDSVTETNNRLSSRFIQTFKGLPVGDSDIVVNFDSDSKLSSIYNNYHYNIPASLDPQNIAIDKEKAISVVESVSKVFTERKIGEPLLIIYHHEIKENNPPNESKNNAIKQFWKNIGDQKEGNPNYVSPKEGEYFIAWKIMLSTVNPTTRLVLMIDAKTGQILNVIDLLKYSRGKVRIFDPNPTISSGDITLSKMTSESTLSKYLQDEDINNIDDPVNGIFLLAGKYVKMKELESPSFDEPKSSNGDFIYSLNDRKFLCVNAYYHIDRFLIYLVDEVQLTVFSNFSIPVDPQGVEGVDNSHYDPVGKYIAFGEGGVPDASDGQVVVHELCHALFDHINPGFDNARAGNNEGNADTGAAIYFDDKHFNPNRTRGLMMPWDASPFGTPQASWPGRRYDMDWKFDQPEYTNVTDPHKTGQLICSTVFELYRKMGGDSENSLVRRAARDLSLRLLFMVISRLPRRNSTATQLGQEIEAADGNLNGWRYPDGLHRKVIYDTFLRRHTDGYRPKETDIYIEDGRHGGYGSISGEDKFSEKSWKDDYWNKGEIWTKPEPYSDDSLQQKGSSADHNKPVIGVSTNLYVKVKNKGNKTSGSGPVNVLAYRTKKGKESVFPDDYIEIGSLTIPNIISGIERGVVVGPFKYTSEGENEAVLVITECDEDQSVTKNRNLSISCSNLVPFDNNIGMRVL